MKTLVRQEPSAINRAAISHQLENAQHFSYENQLEAQLS
jgi:hypothetical protein